MSDTYKEVKVLDFPGMVARVHIPNLTQEERNKRLNKVHNAAAELLKNSKTGVD